MKLTENGVASKTIDLAKATLHWIVPQKWIQILNIEYETKHSRSRLMSLNDGEPDWYRWVQTDGEPDRIRLYLKRQWNGFIIQIKVVALQLGQQRKALYMHWNCYLPKWLVNNSGYKIRFLNLTKSRGSANKWINYLCTIINVHKVVTLRRVNPSRKHPIYCELKIYRNKS